MIRTTRAGKPVCPLCEMPVERAGEFDTYQCWVHVHRVIELSEENLIHMDAYLDITEQPWYSEEISRGEEAWAQLQEQTS